VEHREDAAFARRGRLGQGLPRLGLQDLGRPVPLLGDRPDVTPQRPGDFEPPDLARENGRRRLRDLLRIAGREGGQPELAGLFVKLADRVEPDGDEERVAGERPFRSRDGLEALVDPGHRHGFDALRPVGAEHRMRRIDGNAQPGELVAVDLVPAALGHDLDEADDPDTRLESVVPRDQPDVPAADDEEAARGLDQVAVDECLEGPGAVNPGQGVPGEGQVLLAGPRCHDKTSGETWTYFRPSLRTDLPSSEDGECRALEPDAEAGKRPDIPLEPSGDVDAAGARVHGLDGPEKAVGLEDELPAQTVLVINHQGFDPAFAELDRGRQAGRPTADNEDGNADLLDGLEPDRHVFGHVDPREDRKPLHWLHAETRPDKLHAGLDRDAVSQDQALGTLAVGTEDALGGPVLGMMAEDPDAVGKEGRGDGLSLPRGQRPRCPEEGNFSAGRDGKDGMSVDAKHGAMLLRASMKKSGIRPSSLRSALQRRTL
jgi:hypothetical protein